jgi:uncharacterized damage-inducible protein DinB
MTLPEVWLRGPIDGVPDLLQPVAHALLQVKEESRRRLENFPERLLWTRPAGLASVGFHVQHMAGVVDRLFTYARGASLTPDQLQALAREGQQPAPDGGLAQLLSAFDAQVDRAVEQLRATSPNALTDRRAVGRKQLPSTVMGLLFHAAEHVQRHSGQLLVTAKMVESGEERRPPDAR